MRHFPNDGWRTTRAVITAGCLIALVGFGVRSTFGLFLEPLSVTRGWGRETFALAIAFQNLLWGLTVPAASALADRFGARRVLGLGAFLYAAGTFGMATTTSEWGLYLYGGVLTGLGSAFTSFSIALAAMAKVVDPGRRSMVLGYGTAAGSMGQVVFSPSAKALSVGSGGRRRSPPWRCPFW